MDNPRWERVLSLFHRAGELPATERQAFLLGECGTDGELLSEVTEMLRAEDRQSTLLDGGLPAIADRMVAASEDAVPVREIGPYRLVRILGEGGMGVVWLALRDDTGALAAIKFLPNAALSPARRERFAREIKTLAKLKHPYIARLYDAGALGDGTPWFVMEYVEGLRLTEYCCQRNLSIEERLRLFRKVCEAVQYAHGRAIIHRDLKPSNIFVEEDGSPRLLDFGIARELQDSSDLLDHTQAGLRFFSPDYAAPEWRRDGTVGFFTDVYSLGVMLYELLTGQLPFPRAASDAAPTDSHQAPPKPSSIAGQSATLGKTAWSDLDMLCLKALRAEPNDRYPSVEAFARDLDHFLHSEPLEAQPDSFGYRLGKFLKRNRRPVLAASLTLAAVIGMVVFFTVRLNAAKNAALAEVARKQHIQDFMLSLFGESESSAGPPQDLRAVELLHRGVRKASTLNSDPETQAELYKTLGRMYDMLSDFKKSDELFRLALDKDKLARGPNTVSAADLLIMRGIVLSDAGEYRQAQQSVREGLALAGRLLPHDDPEVYFARAGLGRILGDSGSYKEATEVLQPILDWKPANDFQAQTLSESLASLGVAKFSMGQYDEAEAIDRRALALDQRIFGEVHPRTAADLVNIALNKAARSRYSEAEPYYRQAVADMTKWYGPDNPETANTDTALAKTLIYEGKYDEAYPMLQRSLAIQDKAYGGRDFQIASSLDGLGRIEVKRGNLSAAEADFSRGAEIDNSLYGKDNPRTATIKAGLGDVYTRAGDPRRGEPLLREAVAVLRARLPAGDKNIARAEAMWGNSLVAVGRYRDAEGVLLSAYQTDSSLFQPPAEELAGIRRNLALVYSELQTPETERKLKPQVASASAHMERGER
jgi:serine/threonine-protein kinase